MVFIQRWSLFTCTSFPYIEVIFIYKFFLLDVVFVYKLSIYSGVLHNIQVYILYRDGQSLYTNFPYNVEVNFIYKLQISKVFFIQSWSFIHIFFIQRWSLYQSFHCMYIEVIFVLKFILHTYIGGLCIRVSLRIYRSGLCIQVSLTCMQRWYLYQSFSFSLVFKASSTVYVLKF